MSSVPKVLFLLLLPLACLGVRTVVQTHVTEDSNQLGEAGDEASNAPFNFYQQMLKLKIWGYQSMFCGDDKNCAHKYDWPLRDSYVEMEAAKVAEELTTVPARQRSGEIVRGNDLGFFILSPALWADDGEYQTIGLGVNVSTHEYIRPIFDKILHPSGNQWNVADIERMVRDFLAEQDEIQTSNGIMPLMTKIMHKVHINLELDDAQAKEFMDFQATILPKLVVPSYLTGSFDKVREDRAKWLNIYMDEMEKDTRGVFPADMTGRNPGDKLYIVAAGLMDSMLFAGGLSVEGITKTALNVLYSSDLKYLGDNDHEYDWDGELIDEGNVEAFIHEVARIFPAVVGFSWWEPTKDGKPYDGNKGGSHYTHRTVMNLAMSLRDPRVWGEDFKKFKVRDLEFYQENLGNAWALSANEPGDGPGGLGPMSRGCPGHEFSLAVMTTFLKEWLKQKDQWTVGLGTESGIKFQDVTPFMASNFATFVRKRMQGTLHERVEGASEDSAEERFFVLEKNMLRGYLSKADQNREDPDGVESYDLSKVTSKAWRSNYLFERDGEKCLKMLSSVPWGFWKGDSWEKNRIFCAPTSEKADQWWDVLKEVPFEN